jgi:hypothetical protein
MNVHEFIIDIDPVWALTHFNWRRRCVHDSRNAGGFALEIRVVFLKIVCCAFPFTVRRQLILADIGPKQDPDAVEFRMFAGRRRG